MVLTNREHVIALEARDKGLMGMLLRYPYEVRDAAEYFDDIQDVKITKDMLDLAKHIVEQKSGHFEPTKFEDHYEHALQELLDKKQKGQPIATARKAAPSNVFNLMDALGPVWIHLEFITAAVRLIMASKLISVLSARMAIRLNSLSLQKKFSIRCRHL